MYQIYHVSPYVTHMPMAQAAITRWPCSIHTHPFSLWCCWGVGCSSGRVSEQQKSCCSLISPSRFSTCDRELPREQAVVLEWFLRALCEHFCSKTESCSVTKIKLYLKNPQPTTPLCRCDGITFLSKEKLISRWAARGSWFVQLLTQGCEHADWFPAPPQNSISGAGYKLLFLISRNCNSEFVTIHFCNSCWSQ